MGGTTGPVAAVVIAVTLLAEHYDGVRTGADDACLDCHHIDEALSHPVGIVPSMAVPADMPLVGGRITCVTCHDVATPDDAAASTVAGCTRCHDPSRPGEVHAAATMRAHLAWGRRPAGDGGLGDGTPDPESRRCLSCHDGAVASGVGERYGRGPVSFESVTSRHPIGVVQEWRGPGDNLVNPNRLDARIRLFDGRVGCGSCHSPYSRGPDLLVMSISGSALCLSCHGF